MVLTEPIASRGITSSEATTDNGSGINGVLSKTYIGSGVLHALIAIRIIAETKNIFFIN
jgi:hypothetical protein